MGPPPLETAAISCARGTKPAAREDDSRGNRALPDHPLIPQFEARVEALPLVALTPGTRVGMRRELYPTSGPHVAAVKADLSDAS